MCELVVNDLVEEMSEEIQRLSKELSIERQLNATLNEEVNKLKDQMSDSRGDRSTIGSTVGTNDGNESAVGSDTQHTDPIDMMAEERDTKPVIADHSVSAMDDNQSHRCDQLLDTRDGLKEGMSTHVTSDSGETSMAANKLMIRFKCLIKDCDRKYFAKTSLIDHMINGHQMEDIYECKECDDLCLSEESLNGHKHRAHTSVTVVSTRETSDGLANNSTHERNTHQRVKSEVEVIDIDDSDNDDIIAEDIRVEDITALDDVKGEELIRHFTAGDLKSGLFKCDYKDCSEMFAERPECESHRLTHLTDKPLESAVNDVSTREPIGEESIAKEGDIQTTSGNEIIDSEDTVEERLPNSNESNDSVGNVAIDSDSDTEVDAEDIADHYTCPKDGCDEQFPTSDALIQHMNIAAHQTTVGGHSSGVRRSIAGRQKSADKRVFKCDVNGCDKTYERLDYLNRHRLTHSADKRYKCPIDGCDYQCCQRYLLTAHTNRHLKARPRVCPVESCRKEFATKVLLKAHQSVHMDDQPYRCPQCPKRFISESGLRRHRVADHQ